MANLRRSPAISPEVDVLLANRLAALIEEGWALWERFDSDVREREFHSFVAADYDAVLAVLLAQRGPSLRFLELGSATGVITIMADLLGFEAYGIELDSGLARRARKLAELFEKNFQQYAHVASDGTRVKRIGNTVCRKRTQSDWATSSNTANRRTG